MDQNVKCVLSQQVLMKLDKDGISKPLSKELKKSKEDLLEQLERNYKYYIILKQAVKFLEHKAINDVSHTLSQKDSKLDSNELNKFLEENIETFCKNIVSLAGKTYAYNYQRNPGKAFRDSIKELLSEHDIQTTSHSEILSDLLAVKNFISIYYEDLMEGISLLNSLLSIHKKKINFELLVGDMYAERSSSVSLKIKRFESIIMKATYNEKSVQALSIINQELDGKKENLEEELQNTEAILTAYEALGTEYEEIVKEYSELTKKILEEQWAINSLKK